jgi:hypothetical protein
MPVLLALVTPVRADGDQSLWRRALRIAAAAVQGAGAEPSILTEAAWKL